MRLAETVPSVRNCSIEARRAARAAKAARERSIVDCLNRGLSMTEIAARIGVTEKRMRAIVREIVARRSPAPEEYVAIQIGRLNEALRFAYDAMSADNLRAVALVVRIVRELDRYHGLAPAGLRPARAAPEAMAEGLSAAPARGPQIASQTIEKPCFAPGNAPGGPVASAPAGPQRRARAPDAASRTSEAARPPNLTQIADTRWPEAPDEGAPADGTGISGAEAARPHPAAPAGRPPSPEGRRGSRPLGLVVRHGHMDARSRSAPQAFGKTRFTPGNGAPWEQTTPALLVPPGAPVPVDPTAFRTRFRQALLSGIAVR